MAFGLLTKTERIEEGLFQNGGSACKEGGLQNSGSVCEGGGFQNGGSVPSNRRTRTICQSGCNGFCDRQAAVAAWLYGRMVSEGWMDEMLLISYLCTLSLCHRIITSLPRVKDHGGPRSSSALWWHTK